MSWGKYYQTHFKNQGMSQSRCKHPCVTFLSPLSNVTNCRVKRHSGCIIERCSDIYRSAPRHAPQTAFFFASEATILSPCTLIDKPSFSLSNIISFPKNDIDCLPATLHLVDRSTSNKVTGLQNWQKALPTTYTTCKTN